MSQVGKVRFRPDQGVIYFEQNGEGKVQTRIWVYVGPNGEGKVQTKPRGTGE